MKLKAIAIIILLVVSFSVSAQSAGELNQTDAKGMKQGHWIRKYPDGNILYEGVFKDGHPVGEFKRYNEDKSLISVMIYSDDGREVEATIYHPNGLLASQGKYINQLKEGKWKFFSMYIQNYLVCEEYYTKNRRNGLSVRYYPDSTVAEKINFVNDVREGEWIQYHENGKLLMKTTYSGNKINGKFESWYKDGKPQVSGTYKNDYRDGTWRFYKPDGNIKYVINYVMGTTKDRQKDIDASRLIDSLDLNKDKISDPEKTGIPR